MPATLTLTDSCHGDPLTSTTPLTVGQETQALVTLYNDMAEQMADHDPPCEQEATAYENAAQRLARS